MDLLFLGRAFSPKALARADRLREDNRAIAPYSSIPTRFFKSSRDALLRLLSEDAPDLGAMYMADQIKSYQQASMRHARPPERCNLRSFAFALASLATYAHLIRSHPTAADTDLALGLLDAAVQIAISDGDPGSAGLLAHQTPAKLSLPPHHDRVEDMLDRGEADLKTRMAKIPGQYRNDQLFVASVRLQLMYPDLISALLLKRPPQKKRPA